MRISAFQVIEEHCMQCRQIIVSTETPSGSPAKISQLAGSLLLCRGQGIQASPLVRDTLLLEEIESLLVGVGCLNKKKINGGIPGCFW